MAAETPHAGQPAGGAGQEHLEGGSYEVIRARLLQHAKELGQRADALNDARKQLFRGAELAVLGNERVRTENNCVPCDLVGIGRHVLFGYNVFLGLKSETKVSDVLSLHKFEVTADGFDLSEVPPTEAGGFLADPRFIREFSELYRYYKGTKLVQLRRPEGRLLLVFQVGESARDVKVFRFAVDASGTATYIDNAGERENVYPPSHDFEWTPTGREQFVRGAHPHVNILDEVFVECVGGDLTIKVENNTEDGQGIYSEPVDDRSQSLDDAQIHYARVGTLILLKVLPFREETWRYLVFNTRSRQVARIDAIGQACVQLPEDQGIIFPGGYYLQTGDYKVFEADPRGLNMKRMRRSPNGEDVLYVFHRREDGHYTLLPYNLVRREVSNPIHCHGYSLFDDGKMVLFRSTSDEPARVHPMQVWQTPFVSVEHAAQAAPADGSYLSKVGNADLVRGISEAYTLKRMAEAEAASRRTFEDLIAQATRMVDAYYWLGHAEIGLADRVEELRRTADLIVGEFEKVQALRKQARQVVQEAEGEQRKIVEGLRPESLTSVDEFMEKLAALRNQRGHLITLREVRYVDLQRLTELEKEASEHFDKVSVACVEFLLGAEALAPLNTKLEELFANGKKVERSAELAPLTEELEKTGRGLDVLGEVVGQLQVGDPVARAAILEQISEVFSHLNRVRASLANKRKEVLGREGKAEFGAQFKLLGQAIESAIGQCDSPEKCDEQLSRLTVQLEELEGRFGEFDEFIDDLARRREELVEAFGAKRQQLLDERQRRAQNLFGAAERILAGISRRAESFKTEDELNAYFASDAMVHKARQLSEQLLSLGDSVRADELQSKLKQARQDAARVLRDKKELFEDGTSIIKLGAHRFNVNTQALELTVVPRDGALSLHLTGTDFFETIDEPALASTREFWDQHLVSETPEVYRAEYLAASMLFDAEEGKANLSIAKLREAHLGGEASLLALVRTFAQDRYDEGYERGVHDHDAARILGQLLTIRDGAGLLRFPPTARAHAQLFWALVGDEASKSLWHRRAVSLGRLRESLSRAAALAGLSEELAAPIAAWLGTARIQASAEEAKLAARYLVEELVAETPRFVTAQASQGLVQAFLTHLDRAGTRRAFEEDLRQLAARVPERIALATEWLQGFVEAPNAREGSLLAATASAGSTASSAASASSAAALGEERHILPEAVAMLLTDPSLPRAFSAARVTTEVDGMLGAHPRVREGKLPLSLDEFSARLFRFAQVRVPGYRAFRQGLRDLLDRERRRLKLDEMQPKILSSFVRNRLIGEVYLPLIGQNLAKQIGSAGDTKRTDRMGLLLVISPPGYGKTTLIEYVAARLGLVFVKVNGPALGHDVTSLDPAEAPNAAARQEVERINLAFEMGNNVLLYLDDIQHTSPELLQKFISLCDGQRRIEGVWKGRTRTYDLRGKKFAVVMAGNPYTETGDRFRIPDMLANRADTYNLGEILNGKDDLFALSYVENALTANTVLAPLSGRDPQDVHRFIRMAKGEEIAQTDFAHGYSAIEVQEIVNVLKRLFLVQDTLLKVNQAYIASASQDEKYRTEPPFKLQGSYRNMAKVTEKVVAAMTEEEVQRVLDDHYAGESQTLTTGAEQNLLKLAEMRGRMTDEQRQRWEDIKRSYARIQLMGGNEDDPVSRVTGGLSALGGELSHIRDAVMRAAQSAAKSQQEQAERTVELLRAAQETAAAAAKSRAVPPPLPSAQTQAQGGAAPAQMDPKLLELLQSRLDAVARAMVELAKTAARPPVMKSAEPVAQPQVDLAPYLERLDGVLRAVAQKQVVAPPPPRASEPPVPQVDLAPYLERLEGVLRTMAQKPAVAPPPPRASEPQLDLGPYLDRLEDVLRAVAERPLTLPAEALQRAATTTGPTITPPHHDRQIELVQRALAPLARIARRTLREEGGGSVRSIEVWRHVNEALQLLQTIPPAPETEEQGP